MAIRDHCFQRRTAQRLYRYPPLPLCPGDPDDRLVEWLATLSAEKAGVAVVEDAAVAGDFPVPVATGRGGNAHHGSNERQVARGAVEAGVAVVEDASVTGHQPVAVATGCRGD